MPDIDTVLWVTVLFWVAGFLLSCFVLYLIIFLAVRSALTSHSQRIEDQQIAARLAARARQTGEH